MVSLSSLMPSVSFVSIFVERGSGVAVGTNESEIAQTPILRVAIFMVTQKHYRFTSPCVNAAHFAAVRSGFF